MEGRLLSFIWDDLFVINSPNNSQTLMRNKATVSINITLVPSYAITQREEEANAGVCNVKQVLKGSAIHTGSFLLQDFCKAISISERYSLFIPESCRSSY